MKKTSFIFVVFALLAVGSQVFAAPLELSWDLAKEQRSDIDEKGRYKVHTVPEGWHFEVTSNNFTATQGMKLPSKARYLFHYETEAEITSLEGGASTGIYMGKEGVTLYFYVYPSETQLRFGHSGTISFVSRGKLPQKLVPPAKLKMLYDVETGEISGFINGEKAVTGSTKKMSNMPNLTSIAYTGVCVASLWDSNFAKGTYKSISFMGK